MKNQIVGSWIVVCKATGKAVLETFSPKVAAAINRSKYDVLTALDYLVALNRKIKEQELAMVGDKAMKSDSH